MKQALCTIPSLYILSAEPRLAGLSNLMRETAPGEKQFLWPLSVMRINQSLLLYISSTCDMEISFIGVYIILCDADARENNSYGG